MTFPIPDPTVFLLVLARVAGLVVGSPIFGHMLVPIRVRAGLALVLAVALGGALPPVPDAPLAITCGAAISSAR